MNIIKCFKKTSLYFLLWAICMFTIMTPLLWLSITHPHNLQGLSEIIAQHTLLFTIGRWTLIIALFLFWPSLIQLLAIHHQWLAEKTQFWLKQRLQVTLWLMMFEIIVCESLLLHFIQLWEQYI